MNDEKYYIIYPAGDRTMLEIISLSHACEHELNDYDVASRQSFTEKEEAIEYAKTLAKENDKILVDPDNEGYLD